jgi:integrase
MATFDARAAKLLNPGDVLVLDDHPGLRLEASARVRAWIYRYKSPVDGRMRQLKIGRWPDVSVSGAIVAWEALRRRRDAGEDPAAAKRMARAALLVERTATEEAAKTAAYTVRKLCDDYIVQHIEPHRARKGAVEVERMFATMLGDLAALPAVAVTRAQAYELIQSYAASAPVQAGKLRAELGAAWERALDAGDIPDVTPNWWRSILRGKVRSLGKRINGERVGLVKRVLTGEEVGQLIRWLPNFPPLIADALTLYLWTGARGAEIVGMEGAEVREEGSSWWWVVPKSKTKNARHERATDLRVPLFGRARDVALRRKGWHGDGPLFPARTDGAPRSVEQNTIQTRVYYHQPYSTTRPERPRPRLTVTHWAPHDLRRTARTLLAALGCPAEVGEAVLGHLLPGVMGIYNQYAYDAERVEWLRRLSEHLERLAKE